jgi:type I restriction enzyme S subunit
VSKVEAKNQGGLKPKLRFPEFNGRWEYQQLGEICFITNEKAGSRKYILMSITSGVGLVSQMEKFGREIAGEQAKNYLVIRKNDFAYNKSATKEFPEGFIAMYSGKEDASVPNSIFTCFRIQRNKVIPSYLRYLFLGNLHGRWIRNFIEVGARAHGSLSIDNKDLLTLPVPLPEGDHSHAEQQKIADCLSSLESLISAESQKLEHLQTHKKGLMQQLFPAEGETVPKLRFPEFEGGLEWEKKKFGELVAKSFYGTSSPTTEKGKYPVLRMGNMANGKLDFSNLAYIDLSSDEFEKFRLKRGDILLNRTNSYDLVGKISIFDSEIECMAASYIVTYRLDEKKINSAFCNNILNTSLYQGKIKELATRAVSQANINPTNFQNSITFFLPEIEEQQKIASFLSSLDDVISAQKQKIDLLKTHKKGLMQQLFPAPDEAQAGM